MGISRITQIEDLDPAVFLVASQTSPPDRKSLLAIQNMVRIRIPHYVYLEVGSHVGGTLFPHLIDPLCKHVISVDKRPISQLDERGAMYDYRGNSTQRMLDTLAAHAPPSALLKLVTHDADLAEVAPGRIKADLALIDAEHTNVAVFRDFLAARHLCADSAIIAFHDGNLVFDGLQNIESYLVL